MVLLAVGFGVRVGRAQIVWTGTGGNTNWSNTANWSNKDSNNPNEIPGTFTYRYAEFSGNPASKTSILDRSYSIENGIRFGSGAAAFTIKSGSPSYTLNLGYGGITQNSAVRQTINVNIVHSGSATWSNTSTGSLLVSGSVTLGGHFTIHNTLSGGVTYSTGNLLGSGGISITGLGTTILEGSNSSYNGAFYIKDGGTLQVGNLGATGTLGTGDISINHISSKLVFNRTGTLLVSNNINGVGSLAQSGSGTTILTSNQNWYSGGTQINGGALQIGNGGKFGQLGSGLVSNNAALVFMREDTISVGNVISGSGSLAQSGLGTLTLTGANTYTGATKVTSGILKAGVASVAGTSGAFGNNSAVTLSNVAGAGLDITGFNTQIGSLAGGGSLGGNVTLGGSTLTVGGNNLASTFSGIISGDAGNLIKTGSGTLTLTGANTYTGTTTISAGTMQVGDGGTLGTLGSGAVTNNSALVFKRSDIISVANVISGSGSLTQSGLGTLTLTGANTYTGATKVTSGILKAGVASVAGTSGAFGNNSAVTLSNATGAGLDITEFNTQIGSLAGGGSLGGNVTLGSASLTLGGNNTSTIFAGSITGTGSLTKLGTGNLTFERSSATTMYSGSTTVSAGTLVFSGTFTFAGTLNLSGGNLSLINGADVTFGTINITKNTIIDFGSNTATKLTSANLNIAAGVKVTVVNWVNNGTATGSDDIWKVTTSFSQINGRSATLNSSGTVTDTAPENLISFSGANPGFKTAWVTDQGGLYYNTELRPIPEPSTYAAIMAATVLGFGVWRRRRRAPATKI
jgi:autotransporter-associated beta strand protein